MPRFEDVEVGQQLPAEHMTVEQGDLIVYAGASGDFNPLHWQEDFAAKVSPTGGIIAHGMLNMGYVSRVVTSWAGGPEKVKRLATSFRAPCPVGATVEIGGEVVELDPEARTATLAVWVQLADGSPVVDRKRSHATVQLD
jgi:acyl dehydratase